MKPNVSGSIHSFGEEQEKLVGLNRAQTRLIRLARKLSINYSVASGSIVSQF